MAVRVARFAVNAFNRDQVRDEELFAQLGAGGHETALRVIQSTVSPEEMLFRYLDTVGDGSGTKNAVGDYSSVATEFKITTPTGIDFIVIQSLNIHIGDGAAFNANEYGNISALTNGITVKIHNAAGVAVCDLTDGLPLKTNAQWGRNAYTIRQDEFGSGDNFLSIQWLFNEAGSWIELPTGYSLRARMNDNLSGLVEHYFFVTGHKHNV